MPILPRPHSTEKRRLAVTAAKAALWVLLLLLLGFLVSAMGMFMTGGAVAWLQWLEEHRWHLLTWRLCVYAVTAAGWLWARGRLLQRDPESRQRICFMERIALPLAVFIEVSQWLGEP
ncbi:TPA: hypothetical protein NIA41_000464 [Pseudomonas aeruginosa]|nr:hypothetical protein [Pseudomonas aeruginosa]